jgi:hypothetical protein
MSLRILQRLAPATLSILVLAPATFSQVRVEMSKSARRIPRACKDIQPAALAPQIDIAALVKEAICKGFGDILGEYSYTMDESNRTLDKKGNARKTTTTYEVFVPTLKAGTQARGILIETAKDGVPVSPDKLAEDRRKAGERLEKEEARIDREAPEANQTQDQNDGMEPVGTYSRMAVNHSVLGATHVTVAFTIYTFLRTCNLTLLRQETIAGRPALIFKFIPQPDAKFNEGETYIAQLTGEIAIDGQDHIVTRLTGWPNGVDQASAPPAVYQEMTRLKEGVWLPGIKRVNGADYPKLFDKYTRDWSSTFTNYVRFVTEVKDVKVGEPPN